MLKSIDERQRAAAMLRIGGISNTYQIGMARGESVSLSLFLSNAFWHSSKVTERETRKMMEKSRILAEAELVSAIADDLAKICTIVLHAAF